MTEQPNVVRDYKIGNTRIRFADNYYADKTADDVKAILKGIARKAQRRLSVIEKDEKFTEENADSSNNGNSDCVLGNICVGG